MFGNEQHTHDKVKPWFQDLTLFKGFLGITGGNKISILEIFKPLIPELPDLLKLKLNKDSNGEFMWIGQNVQDKIAIPTGSGSGGSAIETESFVFTTNVSEFIYAGNPMSVRPFEVFINGQKTNSFTVDYNLKKVTFSSVIKKTIGGSSDIYIDIVYSKTL